VLDPVEVKKRLNMQAAVGHGRSKSASSSSSSSSSQHDRDGGRSSPPERDSLPAGQRPASAMAESMRGVKLDHSDNHDQRGNHRTTASSASSASASSSASRRPFGPSNRPTTQAGRLSSSSGPRPQSAASLAASKRSAVGGDLAVNGRSSSSLTAKPLGTVIARSPSGSADNHGDYNDNYAGQPNPSRSTGAARTTGQRMLLGTMTTRMGPRPCTPIQREKNH
jgi:hypothetical protein